jgi:formylglycine-generating enzyme required for sulfatase activity
VKVGGKGGKWGYIDTQGAWVAEPRFDEVDSFHNGLAAVRVGSKWGFINVKGAMIIEPRFYGAGRFADNGLAKVDIDGNKRGDGGKWGYIDTKGAMVIEPRFAYASLFGTNGLAPVRVGGKWGYIDAKGAVVIEPQFDEAGLYSTDSGLMRVKVGGKYGFIDAKGMMVIKPQFDYAFHFDPNGLARVTIGGKKGYIDTKGAIVIEPRFGDTGYLFSDNGLMNVKVGGKGGKWGYIDAKGAMVIEPRFDDATLFGTNGLAPVKISDKWGFIDAKGAMVIEPQFDRALPFRDGLASVRVGDEWGLWGFIDAKGVMVIEPEFDDVRPVFYNGLAPVKFGDKWGFISSLEKHRSRPKKNASAGTANESFTNSIGMEFVLIPAGSFTMGADKNFEDADDDETPPHRVTISKPFYLGKYEVTQTQWEAVMRDNPSRFKGPNNPVEQVSWKDAQVFIKRLNEKEGHDRYRLPSEAEWEYTARAGTTGPYSFGDNAGLLGRYAWYIKNSGDKTHPVGQKKPNAWGLHDMYGNVWEWVQDWYGESYYRSSPSMDPAGPSSGSGRVVRGAGDGRPGRHARRGNDADPRRASRRLDRVAGEADVDSGVEKAGETERIVNSCWR